eukprot:CAMPEP_0196572602 /NCGR_PEP_ID=MMETSP1081-20130531/2619_1 /TAXON_ID=36882 /ORGANISM="Pyramimonas amylifera, Strain CCMP720" /LENGTH=463 /DNA_ID=CAMNT_0041889965 /DNA_START=163 /DNA_END=1551 /DNA_ORIENTATION=-
MAFAPDVSASTTYRQPPAPAHVVGNSFVNQYYSVLHSSSKFLYRFYTDASTLTLAEFGPEGLSDTVTTQHGINAKVASLGYEECKADIHSVDSQYSVNGGVLVQVTGMLARNLPTDLPRPQGFFRGSQAPRSFVQTFFLAVQEKGYYVLNDIFRYTSPPVGELLPSSAPGPAPASAESGIAPPGGEAVMLVTPPPGGAVTSSAPVLHPHSGAFLLPTQPPGTVVHQPGGLGAPHFPVQEGGYSAGPAASAPALSHSAGSAGGEGEDTIAFSGGTDGGKKIGGKEDREEKGAAEEESKKQQELVGLSATPTYASVLAKLRAQNAAAGQKKAPSAGEVASSSSALARPRSASTATHSEEDGIECYSVFVRNIPPSTDEYELEKMFSAYGPLKVVGKGISLKVNKGAQGGCYAFVDYLDVKSAQRAIEAHVEIDGKPLLMEEKKPVATVTRGVTSGRHGSRSGGGG